MPKNNPPEGEDHVKETVLARMPVPKLVLNGFYSSFVIWGQFWTSHLFLNSLWQPAFSNPQKFAERN
jgi:hypothetical protein